MEQYTLSPVFLDWALSHLDSLDKNKAADKQNILETQEKALKAAEKELETLTKMRYRDLIDDSDFVKERNILKDQITRLTKQLSDPQDNSRLWTDLTRRAFIFAACARAHFAKSIIPKCLRQ